MTRVHLVVTWLDVKAALQSLQPVNLLGSFAWQLLQLTFEKPPQELFWTTQSILYTSNLHCKYIDRQVYFHLIFALYAICHYTKNTSTSVTPVPLDHYYNINATWANSNTINLHQSSSSTQEQFDQASLSTAYGPTSWADCHLLSSHSEWPKTTNNPWRWSSLIKDSRNSEMEAKGGGGIGGEVALPCCKWLNRFNTSYTNESS